MVWQVIVVVIVAYLIGSINPSIILSKLLTKEDIRTKGSGNAGTTNTLRTLGKGPAIIVLIVDILKAVAAIYIGKWLGTIGVAENLLSLASDTAIYASGLGVVLGHNFPIYYGFKGGKGVATSLGVILAIEWKLGLICFAFAMVMTLCSRMMSLGSISSAILYPVLVGVMPGAAFNNKWLYLLFAILLALLIIVRHRSNIARLLAGTESKLWKTKAEKQAELK